jgi:hypothetical protein
VRGPVIFIGGRHESCRGVTLLSLEDGGCLRWVIGRYDWGRVGWDGRGVRGGVVGGGATAQRTQVQNTNKLSFG